MVKSYFMRIVAVSATLPNCDDIAYFLECPNAHVFDGSYRPVPLSVHVISCGAVRNNNQFLFDKSLNAKVPVILQEYSNNKPAIVFCHTKKETEIVATELMKKNYSFSQLSPEDAKTLALVAKEVSIPTLQKCLYFGIAYHHAGMESKDRQLVENAFASGVVKCLFATSTL
jgi:ATP-dependent DNA helicase HFM1/MER3